MIDREGFRPNVGIIISNDQGRLLLGRRIGQNAWQFPQGGINAGEDTEAALFRELHEEVGLEPAAVEVLGCTRGWLRYHLPRRFIRRRSYPRCIGQKQVWFMLRLLADESELCLDASDSPEFDDWRWVDYWSPVSEVIFFKRHVYRQALEELSPLVFPEGAPAATGSADQEPASR